MFDAIVTIAAAIATISAPVPVAAQGECLQFSDGMSIVCSVQVAGDTTFEEESILPSMLDACAEGDWAACEPVVWVPEACASLGDDNCVYADNGRYSVTVNSETIQF